MHDATTGRRRSAHQFGELALGLDWHPGGRWVAIADSGGMVRLMNPVTGETQTLGHHKVQAVTATFSPDGDYLFSGGWEGELICWDLQTMQRAFTIGRQSWIMQFCTDRRKCALFNRSGIQLHVFERPIYRKFAEDLGPRLARAAFSRMAGGSPPLPTSLSASGI